MISPRKKILFVARWYPDRHDPMLGLFVRNHAVAVQLLHDVDVLYVTADAQLKPGKVIIENTTSEGVQETKIYFGKHSSGLSNAMEYVKWYLRGVRLITQKSGKPDLVHVHILSRTAIPALWLRFTKGIPYVITEHWSRYLPVNIEKGSYRGSLRKFFTRLAVTASGGVTTVTANLASAMMKLGLKNRYVVIPNVADTGLFHPVRQPENNKITKLVHVSCFDEAAKNIKGIINVISSIAARRNDFVIDIIGDGVDFNDVKQYADKTGLVGKNIFFHGLLTGEELASYMRNADAMVMFSNYENLPCTIVESLCCGVPVISSDVGGIREHITEDMGKLVRAGDEIGLQNAIENILNQPDHFNKKAIAEYGYHHFSLKRVAEQFNDLYLTVV